MNAKILIMFAVLAFSLVLFGCTSESTGQGGTVGQETPAEGEQPAPPLEEDMEADISAGPPLPPE
jgi:hypothetical protein